MDVDEFIRGYLTGDSHHKHFYHFTDNRNLDLIRQHGLLSVAELAARQLEVPAPGGNDWSRDADRRVGMDNYVHLCFFREHPMEFRAREDGRIQKTVFIFVSPDVIRLPGVKICDGVSNKSGVSIGEPADMLEKLDLEVIYRKTDWKNSEVKERRKTAKKYELLVPRHVPANFLVRAEHG